MSRSIKKSGSRSKSSTHGVFVSENAKYKHFILCKKWIILERTVVLNDVEHLNLAQIFRANSLKFLVTIKEQVYPDLVYVFCNTLLSEFVFSCAIRFFNHIFQLIPVFLFYYELFIWSFCLGYGFVNSESTLVWTGDPILVYCSI